MGQQVAYFNEGRGGHILYTNNGQTIKFEFDFGAGNCVVIIYIPTIERWENETKTNISYRQEILNFLCQQVIKDQARGCDYIITDTSIEVMRKPKKKWFDW